MIVYLVSNPRVWGGRWGMLTKLIFFLMVPVQGGPFSDGSEAQGLTSEEFAVCQLFGQPCCAGSCRGFCAHKQPEGALEKHFILTWVCCVLAKKRFLSRDILGNEFHSLFFCVGFCSNLNFVL